MEVPHGQRGHAYPGDERAQILRIDANESGVESLRTWAVSSAVSSSSPTRATLHIRRTWAESRLVLAYTREHITLPLKRRPSLRLLSVPAQGHDVSWHCPEQLVGDGQHSMSDPPQQSPAL